MARSWTARYLPLLKTDCWELIWTGFWSWFPVRSGSMIGATRLYQDLYGERWWPLFVSLRWGPFEVTHRYGGLEDSQVACDEAAALTAVLKASLRDIEQGRLHNHENVKRELG